MQNLFLVHEPYKNRQQVNLTHEPQVLTPDLNYRLTFIIFFLPVVSSVEICYSSFNFFQSHMIDFISYSKQAYIIHYKSHVM